MNESAQSVGNLPVSRRKNLVGFSIAQRVMTSAATGWGQALVILMLGALPSSADSVAAWGGGQANAPGGLTDILAVSTAADHSLALRSNGTVVAWGYNFDGQCDVPPGLSNVRQVAAGEFFSLALRADGTVVAWGANDNGQCDVPADLANVTAISAGHAHALALKTGGTVVAWGSDVFGQCEVPAGVENARKVVAAGNYSLALLNGGSVVAWGLDDEGQLNVPPGLNGVTALAGAQSYCLALNSSGTVTGWGACPPFPPQLDGVVEIAAGENHALAMTSQGILAWGSNLSGEGNVPEGLGGAVGVAASWSYSVVLLTNSASLPSLVISGPQNGAQFTAPATIPISATLNSNGWGIVSVSFFQDGVLLGGSSNAPYTFNWSGVAVGTYVLTAQANYGSGQSVSSGPIQVGVVMPSGSSLPPLWKDQDLGVVGQPGSALYAADGTFTIAGSGTDIWGTADAFHYVYEAFNGNGMMVAKVTGIQDTDGFAKAGLMFRATLDPGSPNAFQFITAAFGLGFQYRTNAGGSSAYVSQSGAVAPYWLKLERKGALFTGYGSVDGTNWTLTGSVSLSMPDPIYAGLAVTAHNNAALNTAVLANVQIESATASTPPVISLVRLPDGTIQLTLMGIVGANYRCDASPDLSTWTPLSTNFNQSGTIQIADPQSMSLIRKFYRAAVVP